MTVDLSYSNLTEVPWDTIPKDTDFLKLNNNKLVHVTLPAGYVNLETVYLYSNNLETLSIPFENSSIAGLGLSFNKLTSSGISSLVQLPNLERLGLRDNNLESLPTKLVKLTELYLSENRLTSSGISPVFSLVSLTKLNLHSNLLTTIPPEIGHLVNLKSLHLNYNYLTSIDVLCQLSNLEQLVLDNNQIEVLPFEIGNLSKLTYLDLANNQISFLPSSVGKLKSLKQLDLKNNNISTLPIEIDKLDNLDRIWLSDNPIRFLPEGVENYPGFQPYPKWKQEMNMIL